MSVVEAPIALKALIVTDNIQRSPLKSVGEQIDEELKNNPPRYEQIAPFADRVSKDRIAPLKEKQPGETKLVADIEGNTFYQASDLTEEEHRLRDWKHGEVLFILGRK